MSSCFKARVGSVIVFGVFGVFGVTAWAGGTSFGTRGGGNAVVCYSSADERDAQHIVSVAMFDYWEQRQNVLTDDSFDLGPASLSVPDKIELALSRIRRFDPERADRYEKTAEDILSNIQTYLTDMDLSVVSDDDSRIEPQPPCYKTQFAIQVANPLPTEKKLQINRVLYESPMTSNDARAGLILHEIIYSEVLDGNGDYPDSDKVRYFNFLLATRYFGSADITDYSNVANDVGLRFPFTLQIPGQERPLLYYSSGGPRDFMILKVASPYHWEDAYKSIDLQPDDLVYVDLSPNQNIIGIKCRSTRGQHMIKLRGQNLTFSVNPDPDDQVRDVSFWENGIPRSFYSENDFNATINGKSVRIQGPPQGCGKDVWSKKDVGVTVPSYDSEIYLDREGGLSSACLAEPVSVPLFPLSKAKSLWIQGEFDLSPTGILTEAFLAQPVSAVSGQGDVSLDFRVRVKNDFVSYPSPLPRIDSPLYEQRYAIAGDYLSASVACTSLFHADGLLSVELTRLSEGDIGPTIFGPVDANEMLPDPLPDSLSNPVFSEDYCFDRKTCSSYLSSLECYKDNWAELK